MPAERKTYSVSLRGLRHRQLLGKYVIKIENVANWSWHLPRLLTVGHFVSSVEWGAKFELLRVEGGALEDI